MKMKFTTSLMSFLVTHEPSDVVRIVLVVLFFVDPELMW